MRVLHVSNRWGGGIKSVVHQYARALPDMEHHLLFGDDPWSVNLDDRLFKTRTHLRRGLRRGVSDLLATIDRLGIDVIHAHSSWAGGLARLAHTDARKVYTPNAFATLAAPGSRTWVGGLLERPLGLMPATIAAVGPDEAAIARRLAPRARVVEILNLPSEGLSPDPASLGSDYVVMCGRVSSQKDPGFFAHVADLAGEQGMDLRFVWLGDGEPRGRALLHASGVELTGWLPLEQLHRVQAQAFAHVHSARYEGACLSILDAAAMGLPTIGRRVPGVSDVDWINHVTEPAQVVSLLHMWRKDDSLTQAARDRATTAASTLTVERQRAALLVAYAG